MAPASYRFGLGHREEPGTPTLAAQLIGHDEQLREEPALGGGAPQAPDNRALRVAKLDDEWPVSTRAGLRFVEPDQRRRYGAPHLFIRGVGKVQGESHRVNRYPGISASTSCASSVSDSCQPM